MRPAAGCEHCRYRQGLSKGPEVGSCLVDMRNFAGVWCGWAERGGKEEIQAGR